MHFGHVLTAMVTPFDSNGQINFQMMTTLIEHLLANGTEGLVIMGTTGESAVLSQAEKESIYQHVTDVVKKRASVIVGTGTNDTQSSIDATKAATRYGVDGIMLVAPYYNRPNQKGLYEHFKTIANETKLPVMLYNIPSRCGVHIHADTIIALSNIRNITALKEASGDLDHTAHVMANAADDFQVYSGDDSMTLPMLAIGATGVVSVVSHIIGKEMHTMVHAFLSGEIEKARGLHLKNLPIMKGIFLAPSPAPIKAALRMQGINTGPVRLPLVDLTERERRQLQNILLQIESKE